MVGAIKSAVSNGRNSAFKKNQDIVCVFVAVLVFVVVVSVVVAVVVAAVVVVVC